MYLLLYQLSPNDRRPLVAPNHRKKAEAHSKYQMNVLNTKKTKNKKLFQYLSDPDRHVFPLYRIYPNKRRHRISAAF